MMSASAPDASPASTMEINRLGNALGNLRTACEKLVPPEISLRTSRTTTLNTGFSTWSINASSALTSGSPACNIDDNCWVNAHTSASLIFFLCAARSYAFCLAMA